MLYNLQDLIPGKWALSYDQNYGDCDCRGISNEIIKLADSREELENYCSEHRIMDVGEYNAYHIGQYKDE